MLELLLEIFDVAPVNRATLIDALKLGVADFEDAVVHQAAVGVKADGIVTRDPKGFKNARIAVYTPRESLVCIGISDEHH
jgi:hypothetical protein